MLNLKQLARSDLPETVLTHLEQAEETAQENVSRARAAGAARLEPYRALLSAVSRPETSKTSRVMMLRHIAGEWSKALTPHSACRTRCTHCCHIAVTLPETEARLIAKKTGRRLTAPTHPRTLTDGADEDQPYGYEHPCVFLKDGNCDIYENRPLACRTLVNMDDVSLLCELIPGKTVPVPYADATALQGRFALAVQTDVFADIRDWFKPE